MNAIPRANNDVRLSSTTLEDFRASRTGRFCCKECQGENAADVFGEFEKVFRENLVLRGCSVNGYLHAECGFGSLSFYADALHGDDPEQVALDLLYAATVKIFAYVHRKNADEMRQRPSFLFTNNQQMAAWTGAKCAEAGC